MVQPKATFSLDRETLGRLQKTSERLGRSKSEVVRMAIQEYSERVGRLSERERLRKLRTMDEVLARPPSRSASEVDREIALVRALRRRGKRRSESAAS